MNLDWLAIQAYTNAREIGPVPKMEGVIASNGEASYFYALRVLHGRFEKGEKSISKIPSWAVRYARFIIRGRFEIAEIHICSNPACCYEYFKHVVRQRLPETMHQAMVMHSFENPKDPMVVKYFKEIEK